MAVAVTVVVAVVVIGGEAGTMARAGAHAGIIPHLIIPAAKTIHN